MFSKQTLHSVLKVHPDQGDFKLEEMQLLLLLHNQGVMVLRLQ